MFPFLFRLKYIPTVGFQHLLRCGVLHDAAAILVEIVDVRGDEPSVDIHVQNNVHNAVFGQCFLHQGQRDGERMFERVPFGVQHPARVQVEWVSGLVRGLPAAIDFHVMVAPAQHRGPAHVVLRRICVRMRDIELRSQAKDKRHRRVHARGQFVARMPNQRAWNVRIHIMGALVGLYRMLRAVRLRQYHIGNKILSLRDLVAVSRSILVQHRVLLQFIAVYRKNKMQPGRARRLLAGCR